jgi:hypothetical protein
VERSFDIYPRANPPVATGNSTWAIDELIGIIPFQQYNRQTFEGVFPEVIASASSFPTVSPYAPTANPTDFAPSWTEVPDSKDLSNFQRIGAKIELDRLQAEASDQRKAGLPGSPPSIRETYLESAAIAVRRAIGKQLVEGAGSGSNELDGLAKKYNALDYKGAADAQVLTANGGAGGATTLPEVRKAIRRCAPSGRGAGQLPDAIICCSRMRDELIRLEIAGGCSPQYGVDRLTNTYRYHFGGLPVLLAPVDEDEQGGSPGNRTSLYVVKLTGPCGIRILHQGGDPKQYGMQLEAIQAGTSANRVYYHLFGNYCFFVPEHEAVSRLRRIDISNEAD